MIVEITVAKGTYVLQARCWVNYGICVVENGTAESRLVDKTYLLPVHDVVLDQEEREPQAKEQIL